MTPHFPPPGPRREPFAGPFPVLPIVTPDAPRRGEFEKYGALFYLGIGGLLVMLALVGWFGWQTWSLRDVWTNVYVLHDAQRSERERIQSAYTLAHLPAVNQRQLWDNALSRPLPPLARYILAEGLTADAASDAPRAYVAAVALSEGWPVWLRLILARPLAYAAARGERIPRDSLVKLSQNGDHATALWAVYALAASADADPAAVAELRKAAEGGSPERLFARNLVKALDATALPERLKALDAATLWLRDHHPDAARLWAGWRVEGKRIVPKG